MGRCHPRLRVLSAKPKMVMSSLYRKRGTFYYQGEDRDGNRVQKSLRTKNREEAQQKKEALDERFGR